MGKGDSSIIPKKRLPSQKGRSPAYNSSRAEAWSSWVVVNSFVVWRGRLLPRCNNSSQTPSVTFTCKDSFSDLSVPEVVSTVSGGSSASSGGVSWTVAWDSKTKREKMAATKYLSSMLISLAATRVLYLRKSSTWACPCDARGHVSNPAINPCNLPWYLCYGLWRRLWLKTPKLEKRNMLFFPPNIPWIIAYRPTST